ncbi:dTDP-4-dehydrorhamnose reductase [Cyanobium sp. Cruz-8D1]|nr:dTDP-4-dehydrorhamnose reductase [Cyanobium sp. Cruz-8H5]MCP9864845.1 dTDP-4-dehydrorhamnose reductase [Cyanobium sp. Cruz-8D1]
MRVLLTGRHGQLGQALLASVPSGVELLATGRGELDLADPAACRSAVEQHRPDWVLNAGAYTAVDRAESEPALAEAVNAGAPGAFADALAEAGGRLLQVSTDFVFDGEQGHPYAPEQALAPLGVYGATKAEGERRAAAALPAERLCLLRTSWVYGPVGANFCLTMLRLHRAKAAAGEPLKVVADQVGCPTATAGLAAACWRVIARGASGRHHWSDCGAASWYDFAVAIGAQAAARGLIEAPAQVKPITTADYPTPARRPAYSLLDGSTTRQALKLEGQHWQAALAEVLAQIPRPQA